ncbi:TetR/AcrR family transcriptional regulator [Enemella sp. A6]|uniref:TetR/AcrR family transcriptional regulator n=1 Tax=Enemella sp. A6 TaxID=3440152 RepID=UPI003EC0160E
MGIREQARADMTAQILAAARAEIAEHGGGGLSMRAVAREVGLVSSAVYRYFPTREALLTAMIIESYEHLAEVLGEVTEDDPGERWRRLAHAFRGWALEHRHEYQLIYGTPVPGYVAPAETVPAAGAVAGYFIAAVSAASGSVERHFTDAELADQLDAPAGEFGVEPSAMGAVLAELSALVGVVSLELSGHFVGTADPADALFAAMVERQVQTLGLV